MKLFTKTVFLSTLIMTLSLLTGGDSIMAAQKKGPAPANKNLIFATTTSVQDTGLLDVLLPLFQKKTGYIVKPLTVGSGQAIALGERGEADVMLAHSPDAEKKLIEQGFGINRRLVMHNFFYVVGPAADPAGIKGSTSVVEAFKKIASSGSAFISRGDNSGTHVKELKIWKEAGVTVEGATWYQQTGLGMGQTLNVASEKAGYTLCDMSTFQALKKNLTLIVILEGDPGLKNIYHVIEINPKKWSKVNARAARAFADFLVSREEQAIIGKFGIDKYGAPLFFPDVFKPAAAKKK